MSDTFLDAVREQMNAERAGTAGPSSPPDVLGKITSVPGQCDKLTRDYALALAAADEIDVSRRGTDARDHARNTARQNLDQALAVLRADVPERARTLTEWADRQGRDRDVTEQLLTETRQGRAWDRTRPLLDQGRPIGDLIRAATDAGDHVTLSALRAELPAYAEARRDDQEAFRSFGAPADLPAVLRQLDEGLAGTLPDDHNEATALRTRLAVGDAVDAAERSLTGAERAASTYADDPDRLRRALRRIEIEDENPAA